MEDLQKFLLSDPVDINERRAKKVFMLNLFLLGINIVDLFYINNGDATIKNKRLLFDRSKTGISGSVKIEPEIEVLIDELKGKTHFFYFQDIYGSHEEFARGIGNLLKNICNTLDIPPFTLGYARYTWSTIAYNALDVSESLIDFALAHKASTLAGAHYIKKKRDKVDKANRRFIHLIAQLQNMEYDFDGDDSDDE
jgi:hypothetical protein